MEKLSSMLWPLVLKDKWFSAMLQCLLPCGVAWERVEWEGTNALRNVTSGIRKQNLFTQCKEGLWCLFWSGLRQSSYWWGNTVEQLWGEREWEKKEGRRKGREGGMEKGRKEGRSWVFQIDTVWRKQPRGPRLHTSVHLPSPQRQVAQMRMNFREAFVEFLLVLQCSNDATPSSTGKCAAPDITGKHRNAGGWGTLPNELKEIIFLLLSISKTSYL